MTLRPLTDRVLIRRIDAETITKFGIVIPDILTTKSDQGIVVAVGPGRYTDTGILIPVEVNVNDKVLLSKNVGTEVSVNDDKLLVIKESDILGVFE